MIASGVDPGASSCLAVVALNPVRLVRLVPVHGVKWHEKMTAAILQSEGPIWCEKPADKVRAVHARHHRAMFGLGRNVGRWEAVATAHGHDMRLLTTAEWWAMLPTRLAGKRGDGLHRVDEAAGMVRGCRAWLDDLPVSRRADAAESVLIAYAGALRG